MPKKSAAKSARPARSRTTKVTSSQKTSSLPRAKKSVFEWSTGVVAAVVVMLLVGVLHVMGWRFYQDSHAQFRFDRLTTVEGDILFTALRPEADDEGEVDLLVRKQGETEWRETGIDVPLADKAHWSWNQALPGVNYEFEGVLYVEGQEVERTDTQPATAPASNVQMALNVTWDELPGDIERPEFTQLSGSVNINGYLPANSVLELYSIPVGDPYEYEAVTPQMLRTATLLTSIPTPASTNDWSWDQAVPGEVYEVVAVLRVRNEIVGVSVQQQTVEAGQRWIDFTLNSTAEAPDEVSEANAEADTRVLGAQSASVSGVVYVQGPEQENTSLLMLWKNPGDTNYQTVNRYSYPPQSGQIWQWGGAQAGQPYNIMAALQVNNNNSSTAPAPQLVTAPAQNVNFTLNTWYVMPATPTTPVFQTCLNRSGNNWTAQISLPPVANAQQYWVQVGTTAGSGNVYNQQFSAGANNQNFIVKVPAQENQQQFVQYAYATCDQCQGDDNFAPFSTSVGFTCQ